MLLFNISLIQQVIDNLTLSIWYIATSSSNGIDIYVHVEEEAARYCQIAGLQIAGYICWIADFATWIRLRLITTGFKDNILQ